MRVEQVDLRDAAITIVQYSSLTEVSQMWGIYLNLGSVHVRKVEHNKSLQPSFMLDYEEISQLKLSLLIVALRVIAASWILYSFTPFKVGTFTHNSIPHVLSIQLTCKKSLKLEHGWNSSAHIMLGNMALCTSNSIWLLCRATIWS